MAGNFHIAPGRSYQQGNMHIHDLSPFAGQAFDFSHTIHKLAFGREYPGTRGQALSTFCLSVGTRRERMGRCCPHRHLCHPGTHATARTSPSCPPFLQACATPWMAWW